jgi:hypothetical protein
MGDHILSLVALVFAAFSLGVLIGTSFWSSMSLYEPGRIVELKAKHPSPGDGVKVREGLEPWRELLTKYKKWKPRPSSTLDTDWRWWGSPGYGSSDPSILDLVAVT